MAAALFLASAPLASAQEQPVTMDQARVSSLEAQMRANIYFRIRVCSLVVPLFAGADQQMPRSSVRTLLAAAQACWNVEPSVFGAFALARFFERGGDKTAADAAIAAAQTRFPTSALLHTGIAGRKARAGDMAGANQALDQAVALGPPEGDRDPDNWRRLADPLLDGDVTLPLQLRLYDEAWRRAEARRDRDEKVRLLRARGGVLLDSERYADALADAERAMPFTSDADRHHVLLLRARARKELGDADGARADFTAAVAANAETASWEYSRRRGQSADRAPPACRIAVRVALGLYTEADGDVDALTAAADECIAAGHPAIGLTLKASERVRLGDRSAAFALLDQAIAADAGYAPAYAVRAAAFQAAERYQDARTALDQAIERDGANARYYFTRAQVRTNLNDRAGARADQERGLGLDPENATEISNYVGNLIALGDHRCALAAVDLARPFLEYTSQVLQTRPTIAREVNKLPREERACATPVAYGKGFEF
jgi:tetratricopeptide (TPR) repeat protein